MDVWPGHPFPLGPDWDGYGTNFALFSENAQRVELCLFDADDSETRILLTEREAFNWHCYIPGVGPGQRYGSSSIPTLRRSKGRSTGRLRTRCRTSRPAKRTRISRSTTRTMRRRFPSASSSIRRSTGKTTVCLTIHGTRW
jgi:hypothetical protein